MLLCSLLSYSSSSLFALIITAFTSILLLLFLRFFLPLLHIRLKYHSFHFHLAAIYSYQLSQLFSLHFCSLDNTNTGPVRVRQPLICPRGIIQYNIIFLFYRTIIVTVQQYRRGRINSRNSQPLPPLTSTISTCKKGEQRSCDARSSRFMVQKKARNTTRPKKVPLKMPKSYETLLKYICLGYGNKCLHLRKKFICFNSLSADWDDQTDALTNRLKHNSSSEIS